MIGRSKFKVPVGRFPNLTLSNRAMTRIHIKNMHSWSLMITLRFCIGRSSAVHRPTIGRQPGDRRPIIGRLVTHKCIYVHAYYITMQSYNTGINYLMSLYKYMDNFSFRHPFCNQKAMLYLVIILFDFSHNFTSKFGSDDLSCSYIEQQFSSDRSSYISTSS